MLEVHKDVTIARISLIMHMYFSFTGSSLGEVCHRVLSVEFVGLFQNHARAKLLALVISGRVYPGWGASCLGRKG